MLYPPSSWALWIGRLLLGLGVALVLSGIFYFFSKLIRYALWSWVPLLLTLHYGMSKADSGYLASVFDASGTTRP